MTASMTNYLKDKLIQHAFKNTSYTPPTTIYMAVFTTPPTVTGGGTEATSYSRVSIMSNLGWDGTGTGSVTNTAQVGFTGLPNGTYVGLALYDASTVGNMLVFAQLSSPKTTTDGILNFPIGDLSVVFA